ncbi:hypothetical protein FF38_08177 [Lucilia cuprina]|uniref:Uncharacterized protein n=1 Tax=Lucilia cuprina TaxID=7375 RepID=A0A0L0C0M6_LUCCU|nr:hypothetical protein FF38_08177 [Lucilia cuprina]
MKNAGGKFCTIALTGSGTSTLLEYSCYLISDYWRASVDSTTAPRDVTGRSKYDPSISRRHCSYSQGQTVIDHKHLLNINKSSHSNCETNSPTFISKTAIAALTVAALLLLFEDEAKVSLELATPQVPPLPPPTGTRLLFGASIIRDQPDLCCLRNLCLILGEGVEVLVNSCGVQPPPVMEDVVAVVTAVADREVQLSLLPLGLAVKGES